jgi:hypothetical protein
MRRKIGRMFVVAVICDIIAEPGSPVVTPPNGRSVLTRATANSRILQRSDSQSKGGHTAYDKGSR